jgi:hypothetical protein
MAERRNPEIKRTFDSYREIARKSTDAYEIQQMTGKAWNGNLAKPPKGEPDYVTGFGPRVLYIEAKWGKTELAFSQYEPEQREWLDAHPATAWTWIWLGPGPAPRKRDAYLIPWPDFQEVESIFRAAGRLSIPYGQPHQIKHRELGLTAQKFLGDFALQWMGDGIWRFPERHAIWRVSPIRGFDYRSYTEKHERPPWAFLSKSTWPRSRPSRGSLSRRCASS